MLTPLNSCDKDLVIRTDPKSLWLHVARIREANGDTEGAARARRNAAILPNRHLRNKFFGYRPWYQLKFGEYRPWWRD